MDPKHSHKKVVLFNGPPGSGKDTAVRIARSKVDEQHNEETLIRYSAIHFKFADPLKQAAHALLGIPYSTDYYEKEFGHKWKNENQIEFYGKTPRSEYIALSEEFAKVRHGPEVFGLVAARRVALEKKANVFLFSDSGFADEAEPLIRLVGEQNIHIVELSRPGHSFVGDSRGNLIDVLQPKYPKIKTSRIPNYGDLNDFRLLIRGQMCKWFKVAFA